MPTNATAHCAHVFVRADRESAPNSAMANPLTTSLMASAFARHSIDGSPRSIVTKRAASPTLCVVTESYMSGLEASHRPSPMLARSEEHTSDRQSLMRPSYAVL